MDDKLTTLFLCLCLSLSLFSTIPLLFPLPFPSLPLCFTLPVTPCHCSEAHVLEEDCHCHPPLSLLAAFGREPLCFMGFSNLQEMPSPLSLTASSEKSDLEDKACKIERARGEDGGSAG